MRRPQRLQSYCLGFPWRARCRRRAACCLERVRRVVLLSLLFTSDVFAPGEWRTHLHSEMLRLWYVIAWGFSARAVPSVVSRWFDWLQVV